MKPLASILIVSLIPLSAGVVIGYQVGRKQPVPEWSIAIRPMADGTMLIQNIVFSRPGSVFPNVAVVSGDRLLAVDPSAALTVVSNVRAVLISDAPLSRPSIQPK